MHYIAILLATTCFWAIDGRPNCTNCGPQVCGEFEERVPGNPKKDRFCRHLYTPPWEKDKLRQCVCKKGFVRNSWGECIPKKNCWGCKFRRYKDWHSCTSGCPATCGQPVSTSCPRKCTPGCECIPGYVVHRKYKNRCVKADSCQPKCPLHSTFKPCISSCEAKCGDEPPKHCVVHCDTGGCVCNKGYAYVIRNGQKICVNERACIMYAPSPVSLTSKEMNEAGSGESRINLTLGAGRNRGATPPHGARNPPVENISLNITQYGPPSVANNGGGVHLSGVPRLGRAGAGEGGQTGPSPFNGGLAGEALSFLRGRLPPLPREGDITPGTGPRTLRNFSASSIIPNAGSVSEPSRTGLETNTGSVSRPGADRLSPDSEHHRQAAGLESLPALSRGALVHAGAATTGNVLSEQPNIPILPGGLSVGTERGTLSSNSHGPSLGLRGMRAQGSTALNNEERRPTAIGANSHPEPDHRHGSVEHSVAGYDESREMAQPSDEHFIGRTYDRPSTIGTSGTTEVPGSNADVDLFGLPSPINSEIEENDIGRTREDLLSNVPARPGDQSPRMQPSSARITGGPSEFNNGETAQSAESPPSNDYGGPDINLGSLGARVNVGHGASEAGLQPTENISPGFSENALVGVAPENASPEMGTFGGLEVPNTSEGEEITSSPPSVRPGETIASTSTGYTWQHVGGSDFSRGTAAQPEGAPSLGAEEYRSDGFGMSPVSEISRNIPGYGRTGISIPRQHTPSDVMSIYGHPHYSFNPLTATSASTKPGERGIHERAEQITPSFDVGLRDASMFMDPLNTHLRGAGTDGLLAAGLGMFSIRRVPFSSAYHRQAAAINADVALSALRGRRYGPHFDGRHMQKIFSSLIARQGGGGFRFLPKHLQITDRDLQLQGLESKARPLRDYDSTRLAYLLMRPRDHALAGSPDARILFRPRFVPVNFNGLPRETFLNQGSSSVRGTQQRHISVPNTGAFGGDYGRNSGVPSRYYANMLYLRPDIHHRIRSVEYELARLSAGS